MYSFHLYPVYCVFPSKILFKGLFYNGIPKSIYLLSKGYIVLFFSNLKALPVFPYLTVNVHTNCLDLVGRLILEFI